MHFFLSTIVFLVDSIELTDLLTKSLEPINESIKRIPICYNAAYLFYSGNRNILITKTQTHTHKYKNIYIYNKNPERFGEIFVDMYENIVLS